MWCLWSASAFEKGFTLWCSLSVPLKNLFFIQPSCFEIEVIVINVSVSSFALSTMLVLNPIMVIVKMCILKKNILKANFLLCETGFFHVNLWCDCFMVQVHCVKIITSWCEICAVCYKEMTKICHYCCASFPGTCCLISYHFMVTAFSVLMVTQGVLATVLTTT